MISSPYAKDIETFWFKNNLETIRKPLKPLYSFLRFNQIEEGIKAPYRYLTPRECFLLMGFSDEDYEKVSYMSRTLLYKMTGNSIVVSVLEEIFNTIEKVKLFY